MFVTLTLVYGKSIKALKRIIIIKTQTVLDIGVDSEDKKVKSNNIDINYYWDGTPVNDNEKQQNCLLPIYSCE